MKQLLIWFSIFWALCSSAWASLQVVPDGAGKKSLVPKTLDLHAQIAGGFARTTATWTFANSATERSDAELIAEAPADAIVTGFAYWFNGKKVFARIVEKARAAEIYRSVTIQSLQTRRDPALVEMLARNFFRVRITPIEAKADLKVEIQWVQPLYFDKSTLVYDCPLWREGETLELEHWSVQSEIQAPPGVSEVQTNFGAILEGEKSAFSLQFEGEKPPPQTLQIRLPFSGMMPTLGLRETEGNAACFAVLLPPKSISVEHGASEIFDAPLNGGAGILRVGRGHNESDVMQFQLPEVAKMLWAAQKLDDLGRDEKNKAATIALSTRYGLPSRWTSWLAIPDEERERLKEILEREKRQQAGQSVWQLGRQMAYEIAAGGYNSWAYKKMDAQFVQSCKILDLPVKETRQSYFSSVLADISVSLGSRGGTPYDGKFEQNLAIARSLYLQVVRLGRVSQGSAWPPEAEKQAARSVSGALAAVHARNLRVAITAGRETRKLRALVEEGEPATIGLGAKLQGWSVARQQLAEAWAEERYKAKPNTRVVAALEHEVAVLVAKERRFWDFPNDAKPVLAEILAEAEESRFSGDIYKLKGELATEIIAHRENGARAGELSQRLRALSARMKYPFDPKLLDTMSMQDYVYKTARDLVGEGEVLRPDAQKIAFLQAELKRIQPYLSKEGFRVGRENGERRGQEDAPNALAQRWVVARYGKTPDADAALFYETKIQTLLDAKLEENKRQNSWFPYERQLAESFLKEAESAWFYQKTEGLLVQITAEQSKLRPDNAKVEAWSAQVLAIQTGTRFQRLSATSLGNNWQVFDAVLEYLRAQHAQKTPDRALIADLERRVIALQPFDSYYATWNGGWRSGRKPSDPQEFGKLRVERIAIRARREKAAASLQKSPNDTQLRSQVVELARHENELAVRMGDPLIAVSAPADCLRIAAILPSGEIKNLAFNAAVNHWEARFDIPTYAQEGAYTITIIVVDENGTRHRLKMRFSVDLSAPNGAGNAKRVGATWELSLQTDAQTDRVEALLPWGERADLKRGENGLFSLQIAPQKAESNSVSYVLTDTAHNRTVVTIDATG